VCETLEHLGRDVIPAFRDRHEAAREKKLKQLEPAIERALARIPPLATAAAEPVEAYPVSMANQGVDAQGTGTRRAVDAGMLWRMHVSGASGGGDDDEG
jgi:hypothetical protein